jgi:uncharacterized protein
MNSLETILVACLAVFILGLGKGGLSGLAALATPIMALGFAPVTAAAILLPILIVQDGVSLWAFHKSWNKAIVAWMVPGAIIGIFGAYVFASTLSVSAVMAMLGSITLGFGVYRLCLERYSRLITSSGAPKWFGTFFGMLSGFTSQIAHAGGPPFQMWAMSKKMPHMTYLGTSTIFFAIVNFLKLPAYFALGEFTYDNLMASTLLVPVAIASSFAGIWIARKVNTELFYTVAYILMVLLGGKLIWDGIF